MHEYRWFNQHQPQTLQSGVILLYIEAVFNVVFVGFLSLFLLTAVGLFVGAFGIANEKKWGYWLGVGLVAGWVAFLVVHFVFASVIGLLFYIALLALLLHPMSRSYRRTWFR